MTVDGTLAGLSATAVPAILALANQEDRRVASSGQEILFYPLAGAALLVLSATQGHAQYVHCQIITEEESRLPRVEVHAPVPLTQGRP